MHALQQLTRMKGYNRSTVCLNPYPSSSLLSSPRYLHGVHRGRQKAHVEAGVVQARKDPRQRHEQARRVGVARNAVHARQVQVLSAHELEGVHVNGVEVASAGGLLLVVVLMHQAIDAAVVQEPVEQSVHLVEAGKEPQH